MTINAIFVWIKWCLIYNYSWRQFNGLRGIQHRTFLVMQNSDWEHQLPAGDGKHKSRYMNAHELWPKWNWLCIYYELTLLVQHSWIPGNYNILLKDYTESEAIHKDCYVRLLDTFIHLCTPFYKSKHHNHSTSNSVRPYWYDSPEQTTPL